MKLSEMDTVHGAQVMAEIAGPIGVLVKNPATKERLPAALPPIKRRREKRRCSMHSGAI